MDKNTKKFIMTAFFSDEQNDCGSNNTGDAQLWSQDEVNPFGQVTHELTLTKLPMASWLPILLCCQFIVQIILCHDRNTRVFLVGKNWSSPVWPLNMLIVAQFCSNFIQFRWFKSQSSRIQHPICNVCILYIIDIDI